MSYDSSEKNNRMFSELNKSIFLSQIYPIIKVGVVFDQ